MTTTKPPINPWLVAAGIAFTFVWATAHVILYIFAAGGGIISELLLGILRAVMFPGTTQGAQPENLLWIPWLQAGLVLTGLAGLPLGLAFFLSSWRLWLLLSAAVVMILGLLVGCYSLFVLVSQVFSTVG
jgi:hypothetical protein